MLLPSIDLARGNLLEERLPRLIEEVGSAAVRLLRGLAW